MLSFDLQIQLIARTASFTTDHSNCNRVVDAMSADNRTNAHNVFNAVRDHLPEFIENLMTLPSWPVWIHESSLHKIIMSTRSSYETFGKYHVLSTVIKTIRDGRGGNKRAGTLLLVEDKYAGHQFTNSPSNTGIAIQTHGSGELFESEILQESVNRKARWFRSGNNILFDLDLQKLIVAEATGFIEESDVCKDVLTRRRANFNSFILGSSQDGGYLSVDVPMLALRFFERMEKRVITVVDPSHINKDGIPSPRAFKHEELRLFSDVLRMMIVSSGQLGIAGKLVVSNNKFVIQNSTRLATTSTGVTDNTATTHSHRTPPPTTTNQTEARKPPPRRASSTLSTGRNSIPDCLLLKNLGVSID